MDEEFLYDDSMRIYLDKSRSQQVNNPATPCRSVVHVHNLLESHNIQNSSNRSGKNFVNTATSRLLDGISLGHDRQLPSRQCHANLIRCLKKLTETPTRATPCEKGENRDLVGVIVEVLPIEEIWVKSRRTWVPNCMAILRDARDRPVKLAFWGRQIHHLFFLGIGQVILVTNVATNQFHSDMVYKMTRTSQVHNFGHFHEIVNSRALSRDELSGIEKIFSRYVDQQSTSLATISPTSVQFHDLHDISSGSIAHVRAKILSIHSAGDSGSARVTLSSSDRCRTRTLLLRGSCRDWVKKLILLRTHTWEFYFLACASSSARDTVELHTTVLSSGEALFREDDKIAIEGVMSKTVEVTKYKHFSKIGSTMKSITLRGVCATSAICTIGKKRLALTADTAEHLVRKAVEKHCKAGTGCPIVAECYLKKDAVRTKFVIEIVLRKEGVNLDLTRLLQNVTDVVAKYKCDQTAACCDTKRFTFQGFAG